MCQKSEAKKKSMEKCKWKRLKQYSILIIYILLIDFILFDAFGTKITPHEDLWSVLKN